MEIHLFHSSRVTHRIGLLVADHKQHNASRTKAELARTILGTCAVFRESLDLSPNKNGGDVSTPLHSFPWVGVAQKLLTLQ
jgi:hypothetical protein